MFEDKQLAWIVFLTITAFIYVTPRVYRVWKSNQAKKLQASKSRHPAGSALRNKEPQALLGVVYPTNIQDQDLKDK